LNFVGFNENENPFLAVLLYFLFRLSRRRGIVKTAQFFLPSAVPGAASCAVRSDAGLFRPHGRLRCAAAGPSKSQESHYSIENN